MTSAAKWTAFLAIGLILVTGGVAMYSVTRGIRNKNPGNIRFNQFNDWNGQTGKDSAGFVIFSNSQYGIRAMGKTLDSYARRGVDTVREIITTWAPTTENNTESYIKSVVSKTGFAENKILSREYGHYLPLIKAIITHENGLNPYSDSEINAALGMV